MQFTAEIIASFLEGEIVGDSNATVSKVAKIEEGVEGAISFLSNPKYEHYIYDTMSSIVIVSKDFTPSSALKTTIIKVDDPYTSFASLLDLYIASRPQKTGVSSMAFIDASTQIPEDCYIGEFSSIGVNVKIGKEVKIYPHVTIGDNVTLGDGVTIYPSVVIYEECRLENNVTVHSGSIIGADGFGFAPTEDGSYKKIPQIGNVILKENVEVGANSCIDRATMGSTVINKGTKIDNLIQIGHNVVVGENCVFAAQVGVAGSTKVGDSCMFGGQVGIAGHAVIANRTIATSQSGIPSSIKKEGTTVMGSPAFDASDSRRSLAVFKSLPAMSRKLSALEKEIAELKAALDIQ